MRSFHTKIVGVTFDNPNGENRQDVIRNLYINTQTPFHLDLTLEYNNPHDPNAVAVYSPAGDQVGFLSRSVATQVSKWLRQGIGVKATATDISVLSPKN